MFALGKKNSSTTNVFINESRTAAVRRKEKAIRRAEKWKRWKVGLSRGASNKEMRAAEAEEAARLAKEEAEVYPPRMRFALVESESLRQALAAVAALTGGRLRQKKKKN